MTARQLRRVVPVASGWPTVVLRPPEDVVPWQYLARCVETDPEVFFPEKGESAEPARRVCAACPVRVECLEFALTYDERYGVWGGLTQKELDRLRRRCAARRPLKEVA